MIGLSQTALANSMTFRTTDSVRFRTAPNTDAEVIRVLDPGTSVEVVDHDPAGWSKVTQGGKTGFIRSDFLKFHINNYAHFQTTDTVRFRASPSTDARSIQPVAVKTTVDVLEHDPAGWSKVRIDGTIGYIRSDFLKRSSSSSGGSGSGGSNGSPAQSPSYLRTSTDGVRIRKGPTSNEDNIIRTLPAGTIVEILEKGSDGWSHVKLNDGTIGYISSDYLNIGIGDVELLDWSVAKDLIPMRTNIQVTDVRTGIVFNLRCFSKSGHCDVEPPTQADTDAILRTRNGVWAWAPRPVWVTIGNRTIAASLNGMPHDVSTISGNGMNGHLCLHFNNTVTNSKSYQRNLNNAVMEAWNARQ